MQTLHVITHKEALLPARLPGKVVVVLDVLFATTTIAMALAAGARSVWPVLDETAAREAARHSSQTYLLAGEQAGVIPDGFAPFGPQVLSRYPLRDQQLILTTSNGTVALQQVLGAAAVYTAALVNARAVAGRLLIKHREQTLLLVCAGSHGRINIEDLYGAGCLIDRLDEGQHWHLSDTALTALAVYRSSDALTCLQRSRVGRLMDYAGLGGDVCFSAQEDIYTVVPQCHGEQLLAEV